jgi:DDE_Tnp_1-associated
VPASLSLLIDRVPRQSDRSPRMVRLGSTGQECLFRALLTVPDPRDPRGVRHGLPSVMAMAIAAVLAGSTSFYAIGQWIAGAGQKTLKALGARRDPVSGRYVGPDEKASRRRKAAGQRRTRKSTRGRHVPVMPGMAVEGKTARGARTGEVTAPHLLAAVTHGGVVLAQRQIAEKSNEITAFIPLLQPLDLSGVPVVSSTSLSSVRQGRSRRAR